MAVPSPSPSYFWQGNEVIKIASPALRVKRGKREEGLAYGLNYFGPVGERNNFSHKEIILAMSQSVMAKII